MQAQCLLDFLKKSYWNEQHGHETDRASVGISIMLLYKSVSYIEM